MNDLKSANNNQLSEGWYRKLVEECKAIITESVFASRIALVDGNWELGKRIREDVNFKEYNKGNKSSVQDLARNIGQSERTLYYALAVFDKYPDKNFPEGKNISMNKLITKHLPKPKKEPNILIPANGEYQVVVIDPPWPYGTEYNAETRRVASPYPELSIEKLSKFKIPATEDSIIWLWTTHKFLPDSFNLLKIWNFEYKVTLVWNKIKMGMGFWLRMQSEFCLLGVRGKPDWNLTNEKDILNIKRREHSRKPDEFYNIVKNLTPNTNRIDIFSREIRDGFTQYGNEPAKF